MPIKLLPTLLLYILVVGYSPGPANIFALGCSLRHGQKAAMRAWWGLVVGFSIVVCAVAFICWSVDDALTANVKWFKYLGAAYIIWIAWSVFRSRGKTGNDRACTFLGGLTVQLTNAKMILFDFMVMGMFVTPYSNRLADFLVVAVLLLLAGPGANLAWLLAGSWLSHFLAKYRTQVDVVMALALVACAVSIILS